VIDESKLSGISHFDSIPHAITYTFRKVARDPEYDDIANNKFPTVIGVIVTITK
jgi:hypothetical protein